MELRPTWISTRAAYVLESQQPFRVKAAFDKVLNLQSEAGIISAQTGNTALTPLSMKLNAREYEKLLRALPTDQLFLSIRNAEAVDCSILSHRSLPADGWVARFRQLTRVLARDDSLAFAVSTPLWHACPEATATQQAAREILRNAEDYLITPRVMKRTVDVPGLVTVIAVLIGGALLGIIGALIAIPIAATIKLVLEEVSYPRLDES